MQTQIIFYAAVGKLQKIFAKKISYQFYFWNFTSVNSRASAYFFHKAETQSASDIFNPDNACRA